MPIRPVRKPEVKKAVKVLKDSQVPHEVQCTCSGCRGVRNMDQILGR